MFDAVNVKNRKQNIYLFIPSPLDYLNTMQWNAICNGNVYFN